MEVELHLGLNNGSENLQRSEWNTGRRNSIRPGVRADSVWCAHSQGEGSLP